MSKHYTKQDVRCYSIRRVNPFLGVLQIIQTPGGRAISANGVVWDIEVLTDKTGGWGSLASQVSEKAYYRFGLWSLEDGLVTRPLAPHLQNDPLTYQCNFLIEAITDFSKKLPFQLADNFELWLFDSEDLKPIALLASLTDDMKAPSPEPRYWVPSIGANGVAGQYRFTFASEIESQVRSLAGFNIKKHWVHRRTDGSGVITDSGVILEADKIPEFLITEHWNDHSHQSLVSDYIDWISPSLLTLQNISQSARARLEQSLHIQAVSIEHHCNLYPEIINQDLITTARVQCRIQKSI